MLPAFRSEPFTDFSRPENISAFREALDFVKSQMEQTYPLVIGGQRITADRYFPIHQSIPSGGSTGSLR